MIDVFIPLKSFLRIGKFYTDNTVFRLHYRLTVILLVTSMLLVTSKQLFGDPIHCFGNGDEPIYKEALNSFCWMYGTYVLTKHYNGEVGRDYAQPGVGPGEGERVHLAYYQWVFLVLMLQAISFYLPHYLWKIWENGRIRALTQGLDGVSLPAEWSTRRAELLEFVSNSKLYTHNLYALRFFFCECLNLANVVAQIYLLDWFLGGTFLSYGPALAALTHAPPVSAHGVAGLLRDGAEPAARRFPKLAKCTFYYYGPTATLQNKDLLCVLPINVLNEKIFALLWFWYAALALVSAAKLAHTALLLTCAPLRALCLLGQLRGLKQWRAQAIAHNLSFGDWFVLRQLGDNLNPALYQDLLTELAARLEARSALV